MEGLDVIAVDIESGKILWIEPDKTEANAEAIISLAVMRQGVEDRFYVAVPSGQYNEGDKYRGQE